MYHAAAREQELVRNIVHQEHNVFMAADSLLECFEAGPAGAQYPSHPEMLQHLDEASGRDLCIHSRV